MLNAKVVHYGIFEKHNRNTRIWYFDFLEMDCHQPQTSIANWIKFSRVVLWMVDGLCNLECPKLKIHIGILRNVSLFNTSHDISHNFLSYISVDCDSMKLFCLVNNSLLASNTICEQSPGNNLSPYKQMLLSMPNKDKKAAWSKQSPNKQNPICNFC